MVVRGSAIISPIKPSNAPQTDSESKRMAGLSLIAFPIILGVTTISEMICTMINTNTAIPKIIQKFCPVSAAFSNERNAVGINANVCRYGTRSMIPMRIPIPIAMGKSMMVKPMQNITPMMSATSPWPRM